KYSYEFKLMIVKEYLENSLGYGLLAKKHGIPSQSPIERWVRAYKEFGEDGLRRKHSKQVYPVQFKLDVLNFMKQTGASYQDTAKGRPPMSKNHKPKPSKQETELSREELLERENELLRLENAYLKKLKAFQENPNAFLEKHKQRWRSNSKKKDSN